MNIHKEKNMKKAAALFIVIAMAFCAFAAVTEAAGGTVEENKDYGGAWEINESTYVCRERIEWPNFGVYMLGNADGKIGLYMETTVADKSTEPDGLGGDSGFMVGITDKNGNGIIEESVDEYYLIDISCSNDGGFIAIEKNAAKWGDWSVIDHSSSFQKGAKVGMYLIYDPDTAYFAVYISEIDDAGNVMTEADPWIEWTDGKDPLQGKGFGICSKITDGVISNVKVSRGDSVAPPEPSTVGPAYGPDDKKILLADFTDPETINKTIGTGHDCEVVYDEEFGCLKATVTGPDPFFKVPMNLATYFDGDKFTGLLINYKTVEYSQAEIFFTTKTSRDIARNHLFFDLDETDDFVDLFVDMTLNDHGTWTDQIRSVRIDPDHAGTEDGVFYFKYVYAVTEDYEESAADTETETAEPTDTDAITEPEQTVTDTDEETPAAPEATSDVPGTVTENTEKPGSNKTAVIAAAAGGAVVIAAAAAAAVIISKKKCA